VRGAAEWTTAQKARCWPSPTPGRSRCWPNWANTGLLLDHELWLAQCCLCLSLWPISVGPCTTLYGCYTCTRDTRRPTTALCSIYKTQTRPTPRPRPTNSAFLLSLATGARVLTALIGIGSGSFAQGSRLSALRARGQRVVVWCMAWHGVVRDTVCLESVECCVCRRPCTLYIIHHTAATRVRVHGRRAVNVKKFTRGSEVHHT
jgi:hypothetical protein